MPLRPPFPPSKILKSILLPLVTNQEQMRLQMGTALRPSPETNAALIFFFRFQLPLSPRGGKRSYGGGGGVRTENKYGLKVCTVLSMIGGRRGCGQTFFNFFISIKLRNQFLISMLGAWISAFQLLENMKNWKTESWGDMYCGKPRDCKWLRVLGPSPYVTKHGFGCFGGTDKFYSSKIPRYKGKVAICLWIIESVLTVGLFLKIEGAIVRTF